MDKSNITLHIRYKEPIRMNGFLAEKDTITFADREELIKYVNGEPAYDVLDDIVRKKDNEILLYADNENGDILWQAGVPGRRMFVDMDGTLAVFHPVECLETLYEPGYFQNLEPLENVVEAVRKIVWGHPEIEVYVLSAVLSDSRYALEEKNAWLDRYLPEIDADHRIFPPCGENKLEYVPDGICGTDYLLDDYTHNLALWEPPAKGIKLLNGINHTNGTWQGSILRYDMDPEVLAGNIVDIMEGALIQDMRPLAQLVEMANAQYDHKGAERGYILDKSVLHYLTQREAVTAFNAGIRICAVDSWSDYHGSHKDEYRIRELWKPEQISKVYNQSWKSIEEKMACISPFYENPGELKRNLERECDKEQVKGAYDPGKRTVSGKRPSGLQGPKL